jgi:hypothetical protein
VPPARHDEEEIKLLQKHFRFTLFVKQTLAFSAPNLSLNRILLKIPKKIPESGPKIQLMEAERMAPLHAGSRHQARMQRAELDVLELFSIERALQRFKDFFAFLGALYERLAVVGKRERDKPIPGQPTSHATQRNSIRQGPSGCRGCVDNGFIAIGAV